MTERNPVFRKTSKLRKRALIVLMFIFAIPYLCGISELATGSYIKNRKDLIKLDNVTLLGKAYFSSGGRHGVKSVSFQDIERRQFRIGTFVYNSIADIDFILDTLEHHGTKLAIYTEKDDYEKYIKKLKDKTIDIYQIEIAGKQCVNLEDVNAARKRELIFRTSLFTLVFFGVGIGYRRLRQNANSI